MMRRTVEQRDAQADGRASWERARYKEFLTGLQLDDELSHCNGASVTRDHALDIV